MQQLTYQRYIKRGDVENLINPINGYRGKLEAQGLAPKNHMQQNKQALKKTEEKVTNQRKVEEEKMSKVNPADTFKMKKFTNVGSKIKNDIKA